jgi:hypothetical protein
MLEALTALGTMGAAVFAGWATLVSARSAKASQALIAIERMRDRDRVSQIVVNCGFAPSTFDAVKSGQLTDWVAKVRNLSPAPYST